MHITANCMGIAKCVNLKDSKLLLSISSKCLFIKVRLQYIVSNHSFIFIYYSLMSQIIVRQVQRATVQQHETEEQSAVMSALLGMHHHKQHEVCKNTQQRYIIQTEHSSGRKGRFREIGTFCTRRLAYKAKQLHVPGHTTYGIKTNAGIFKIGRKVKFRHLPGDGIK